jgi:hypothetical protein
MRREAERNNKGFGKPTLERAQTPMKGIMEGTYERESGELYNAKGLHH